MRAGVNEPGEGEQKSDNLRSSAGPQGECNLTMGYEVIYKRISDVTNQRESLSFGPAGNAKMLLEPAAIAMGTVALLSNCS
jgi:hypothetical protein